MLKNPNKQAKRIEQQQQQKKKAEKIERLNLIISHIPIFEHNILYDVIPKINTVLQQLTIQS